MEDTAQQPDRVTELEAKIADAAATMSDVAVAIAMNVEWPPNSWAQDLLRAVDRLTSTGDELVVGGTVTGAGGGEVRLLIDRDTDQYPAPGQHVAMVIGDAQHAGEHP